MCCKHDANWCRACVRQYWLIEELQKQLKRVEKLEKETKSAKSL